MENLQPVIDILYRAYQLKVYPILLAVLVFLFLLTVAIKAKPQKKIQEAYNSFNDRILKTKNKKSSFDFDTVHNELLANGILYRFPWMDSPANYIGMKIILSIVCSLLFCIIHVAFIPVGFLLGYKLIDMMIYYINRHDNKVMQNDIQLIYNLLLIQSKSNIYLPDALCDCVDLIDPDDKRLIKALETLKGDLYGGKTFKEALEYFNDSFNNSYIDSMCVTLLQAADTGLAANLLKDINAQVQHFTALQLNQETEMMDMKVTIAAMIFVCALLFLGLNAGISQIADSLSSSALF